MGGASLDDIKSATLDHMIALKFSNDNTAEMPAPKSTVHWVGACANDYALIRCVVESRVATAGPPVTHTHTRTHNTNCNTLTQTSSTIP